MFLSIASAILFMSCEKNGPDPGSGTGGTAETPVIPGTVEVRGDLIDIRAWKKDELLYPQHKGYTISSAAVGLFSTTMKYSVGLMESSGPLEVRSGVDGVVTVAVDSKNMPSEYISTGKTFSSGDVKYYLYLLRAEYGKWVTLHKPSDSKVSLMVFAENLMVSGTSVPWKVIGKVTELRKGAINNVSIAILPDGSYIASCTGASEESRISLFKSTDKGLSWQLMTNTNVSDNKIHNYYNLFVHKGSLYMMGVGDGRVNILISRSDDGGVNWTVPTNDQTGIIRTETAPGSGRNTYHSAAVPMTTGDGRIWRAMEEYDNDIKSPFMMSAPEDADLLKASSWTYTNTVRLGSLEYKGHRITEAIEGNAVVTPDGKVYNMLRGSCETSSSAAIRLPVTDISNIAPISSDKLIEMPGAGKKFTMRYDPVSRKYWAITNPDGSAGKKHNGIYAKGVTHNLARNQMVLVCSDDLVTWVQKKELMFDPDPFFHGFQYVDWQFDGNNIVAVCRMACPEQRGLPERQHDANLLTFQRISNFRNL